MRKSLQGLGVLLSLMGVSGVIDRIWAQPIMGVVLNAFDRHVVSAIPRLEENAILAGLGLAVCGIVLVVAMESLSPSRRGLT